MHAARRSDAAATHILTVETKILLAEGVIEVGATGPVGGAHGFLALRFNFQQLERLGGGADPHVLLAGHDMAGFKRCRCVRIGYVGRLRAQYVQGRRFGVRMGMQFAPGSRIRRACANLAVGGEYPARRSGYARPPR